MCSNITSNAKLTAQIDDITLLKAIYSGINVYQNYTGKEKCFGVSNESAGEIDMLAWSYQVNTSQNMRMMIRCNIHVSTLRHALKWCFRCVPMESMTCSSPSNGTMRRIVGTALHNSKYIRETSGPLFTMGLTGLFLRLKIKKN